VSLSDFLCDGKPESAAAGFGIARIVRTDKGLENILRKTVGDADPVIDEINYRGFVPDRQSD
jgi:hypothetical protein